jgi:hypothetical protein
MKLALVLICLVTAAMAVTLPAAAKQHLPPPACPIGQQLCNSPLGSRCYSPSNGEVCATGIVCGLGQQACAGPFGQSCYAPSRGEFCTRGLVCGLGQQACVAGGQPRCYSPSRGETCG